MLAITVRRNGIRVEASARVLVQRLQQPKVAHPGSRVDIDVGTAPSRGNQRGGHSARTSAELNATQ